MNRSGESRKEATGNMMEILNAKNQTKLGFWKVRTMFEMGKLAYVLVKGDGQAQADRGQAEAKQFCILAEMTTYILREQLSF